MTNQIEQTLILVKPDGVHRGLVGTILSRFEQCGLKIIGMKMKHATEELADQHYQADQEWMINVGKKNIAAYEERGVTIDKEPIEIGREIQEQLKAYITSSPLIAFVLEGHNAIKHAAKLVGDTAPSQAAPGTIRGDYSVDSYQMADSSDRPIQNLLHASEDQEEAEREINLWFDEDELCEWDRIEEHILYRTGDDLKD